MQELKPQTDKMAEAKKAYAKVGDKMGEQREAQKVMLLYKERGVNPFSAIGWGFLPAVVLISFFFAIRGIVDANVPGLGTQGILWVKDLTVTDETYIMPVLSMIGFLGAYSAGLKTQTAAPNGMISKLVVPLSVVGLIASSWFPAVWSPGFPRFDAMYSHIYDTGPLLLRSPIHLLFTSAVSPLPNPSFPRLGRFKTPLCTFRSHQRCRVHCCRETINTQRSPQKDEEI